VVADRSYPGERFLGVNTTEILVIMLRNFIDVMHTQVQKTSFRSCLGEECKLLLTVIYC